MSLDVASQVAISLSSDLPQDEVDSMLSVVCLLLRPGRFFHQSLSRFAAQIQR